jgi:hypothetical protein
MAATAFQVRFPPGMSGVPKSQVRRLCEEIDAMRPRSDAIRPLPTPYRAHPGGARETRTADKHLRTPEALLAVHKATLDAA